MAGKMRVAAKLFLGTSVLASTGGGAYYYTMHGTPLPGFLHSQKPAAAADLDAVASAWAEPPAARKVDPTESSAIARSAKPEPVRADKAADVADRYAIAAAATKDAPTEFPAPAPIAKDGRVTPAVSVPDAKPDSTPETPVVAQIEAPAVKKEEATAAEPTLAVEEPSAKPATESVAVKVDTADAEPMALATTSAPSSAAQVARGQEPKDDAAKIGDSASDLGSAFDAVTSDGKSPTEPKPLAVPTQSTKLNNTSARAKQAFNTPTTSLGNERYGDAAPMGRDAQAAPSNGALNPFSASSSPAGAPTTKPGMIEPLPPAPSDLGNQFNEPRQNAGGLRPLEGASGAGSASSMNRDIPARTPIGQMPSRQSAPNPYTRPPAAPNALTRNNDNITPIPMGDGTGKPGEKALEGTQQPTLVIQKLAPSEIQVGKTAKFVVQIRNAGAQSADGVVIRDEIPQGTKLVSTSPNATTEGSHIIWQIGKLSPGEDRTVEMQLMPMTEGEIGSVATVSYTAQASVKTRCTMPQLAIRMTAPTEVMIGNQQHVKIEIRNPGTGDATHVMLFENVPQNVKHASGPALEFEIGTLHPNETRELDLVLTAEKAGKVLNVLTAKADGNLQVQQQVEFEVIAPGLSVQLDGPERRYLERPATYEVSVQNPGTAPAHDVQIVTKLPKGMKFVKANNMGEYDAATHAVYWSLAELPKGERGTVELVAMPTETGAQTLQVDGHAQQGLTDHKQRDIMVEGLAAIMFEVRDLEDPIEVGGETGYEIRIVNQGTKAATNVQVAVDVPPGLKVISAEGEVGHKMQDGRLIFEPIQQIAPKADTVLKIRAQGVQPGDQRVTVQVNTDDMDHPIRREESTRVFGDQ